jgi:hypothetical protein
MGMPVNVNIVTVLIVSMFVIPLLAGAVWPPTGGRIRRSFASLFGNLLLLASVVLSVYLTRVILSGDGNDILAGLYAIVPELQSAVASRSVWVYVLFISVITLAVYWVLYLLMLPIYRHAFVPIADTAASAFKSMGGFARRTVGLLWQLPRAVWLVLALSILINFYTGSFKDSVITECANNSVPYQLIQGNVIQPLLNNSVVKNIRVILNDSFKRAKGESPGQLTKYFNGVALDEAIRSNPEIDAEARRIAGRELNDRRKAYFLYAWICKNMTYDNGKAAIIARDASGVSSGAAVAYDTRTGVCFDFSCLYVAMCRAVGLQVRFVTGLGYTGTDWGDHAWNQVYDPKDDVWVNVDTTFGNSGIDYFDRPGFDLDHADAVVQGEW